LRPEEFQERLRSGGYLPPSWDNGNRLRRIFEKSKVIGYIWDLSDEEFESFLIDPFDPKERRFQYSRSPGVDAYNIGGIIRYEGDAILLTSVGPDGDVDLDISGFDLAEEHFGLGRNYRNNIYDPTNGLLSSGDLVFPLGNVSRRDFGVQEWDPAFGFCEKTESGKVDK
jgi:hypothetical protein